MQVIYGWMEALLPFSWIQFDFMKNALLAVLIITPLFGILAGRLGTELYPWYLLILALVLTVSTETANRLIPCRTE